MRNSRSRSLIAFLSMPMKINRVFCCVFAFTVIYLGAISIGSAQIYAKDDAANYGSSPGNSAWVTGASSTNGGFGFNPWVFTRGGSGFQGFFLGNGDAVGSTNGNYWGMYANSGSGDNVAVAYRGFTNSLQTNTVFKIKWHTLGIGFDASHRGGFSLRNGNVNATTNDFDTGTRFDFYYIGGG